MIFSTIGQGLIWSILGIGIFMTYRILNFPDMTTEGSFPLGGAVTVAAIAHGITPILATCLGIGAGMLAGLCTGLLYTKGKIPVILAGILVMSGLNSVNLFVMGRANLSLLGHPRVLTFFTQLNLPDYYDLIIVGLIATILAGGLLYYFFTTQVGQAYIATGDNEMMARSLGINTDFYKTLGLVLSNGLIALSGSLVAQNDGYADVNKGIGVIVIGLASIIIGEVLFGELTMGERIVAIVIGSIFYQLLVLIVIQLGFNTTYLKIFTSIILAICLMIPQMKKSLKLTTGFEKGRGGAND